MKFRCLEDGRTPAARRTVAQVGHDEVSLSSDPVEQALADIRHLTRAASLALALDVGEIVFHRIFAGDAELVRRRGPKESSFRRLALHPELPMSAATLWRAVAIYEMSLRVPLVARSPSLGIAHARSVLGLSPRNQQQLIERAAAEGWSVSRLALEAAAKRTGRGGRRRKSEVARVLDSLRRLAALPEATVLDPVAVRGLSSEDVDAGLTSVREVKKRLERLEKQLNAARSRRR